MRITGFFDPVNPLGENNIDILICGIDRFRCPAPATLRTEGRPPCTVVVDRGDDVRFTRAALAVHDPSAGRVVVHPTVVSHDQLLWHDVLQALGGS